jgi:coproporphyrinogen III oxidase
MGVNVNQICESVSAKQVQSVRDWFLHLQQLIISGVQALDGCSFVEDQWLREPVDTGGGRTCMLENGRVFERAGVGFSHVKGDTLPPAASVARPHLVGCAWEAMGVSLVFHPMNPFIPTVHFNTRFFVARDRADQVVAWWFGGGMDLTPYYPFREDVIHFHQTCRDSVAPFGEHLYTKMKQDCDDYFVLKHRGEQRGVGGIFYDDFDSLGFEQSFAMTQSVGTHFLKAYEPIVQRRAQYEFGERERAFQAFRRGRYVEFNLVFDRGTLFGLQTKGRVESILLSMPPMARWGYQWKPEDNSVESQLVETFLTPRDWVNESFE